MRGERKREIRRLWIATFLASAIWLGGCTAKDVAVLNYKLSAAALAFDHSETILHSDGKISDSEDKAIASAELKFAQAGMALDAGIIASETKASLSQKAQAFADAFLSLQASALGVKNPNSQAEFSIAMSSIKIIVDSLVGLVQK
jgi:hypothetical protein